MDPPLVGVAVTVTDVPGQNGLVGVEMETPAGRLVLTIIVIAFDIAGFPVTQLADEVTSQVTTSPFTALYA